MTENIYLHPLTSTELFEVKAAVDAMIEVLPEGDDERGQARVALVSAREKLDRHWCAWCPVDVRDLAANAHNAFVNHGSGRAQKKMADLGHAINHYQRDIDAHFAAVFPDSLAPRCAHLVGCETRPGGTWHDTACPCHPDAAGSRA